MGRTKTNFRSLQRIAPLWISFLLLTLSITTFAKNNDVTCKQIEDVIQNGQRYMQFVFTDSNNNYTTGYLESYDDPGKGSFFCAIHPIAIESKSTVALQQLQQFHTSSVASMKQHALALSKTSQRQQVDRLYLQGAINADQAAAYYQQIEYAQLIAQAAKEAKKIRKKNKKAYQPTAQKNTALPKIAHQSAKNNNSVKNQLAQKKSIAQFLTINPQTSAFLQMHNIDVAQFQQISGLSAQDQVTRELVEILDSVATHAPKYQQQIDQAQLVKHCARLASVSQQANVQGAVQQAIDGTNCCHGIDHYLQGMISSAVQAYEHFQTALDYFDKVTDSYGNLIAQHAAQGAIVAQGLESIVAAGMVAAPTATLAAGAIAIGATAYVMAPVCFQALMHLNDFGNACITGDWNKIATDLDNFGTFVTKPETVAHMAEFAGGTAIPTPNLNYLINEVVSLRPVITSVQNASGQIMRSYHLMSQQAQQKVWQQANQLLQRTEFVNFNLAYKKIFGVHFFDIAPKSSSALAGIVPEVQENIIISGTQTTLTNVLTQTEKAVVGTIVRSGTSSLLEQPVHNALPADFTTTPVGQKMLEAAIQDYEKVMLRKVSKAYDKLCEHEATDDVKKQFCLCHEVSIVPNSLKQDFIQLHAIFKKEFPEMTMQMRHIFYPNIKPDFDDDYKNIVGYTLEGFHHDEFEALEKAGKLQWKNKIYGKAEFGAEECFIAEPDFNYGIMCDSKTYFPSNWSREKTARVIFEASQNRIKDLTEIGNPNKKFLCRAFNLFIEIIINSKNVIISAYPSMKNF